MSTILQSAAKKLSILGLATLLSTCGGDSGAIGGGDQGEQSISGYQENWYRVLFVSAAGGDTSLTVIQGEYLKIFIKESLIQNDQFPFVVTGLGIDSKVRGGRRTKQFFKISDAGSFPFTLGQTTGQLVVKPFDKPRYEEIGPEVAFSMVNELKPLLLDVREPIEFGTGTIGKALNIPVNELEQRLPELALYRKKPILVYGRTGRLSTDAVKILRAEGFMEIYHLKHGIVGWASKGHSVQFF